MYFRIMIITSFDRRESACFQVSLAHLHKIRSLHQVFQFLDEIDFLGFIELREFHCKRCLNSLNLRFILFFGWGGGGGRSCCGDDRGFLEIEGKAFDPRTPARQAKSTTPSSNEDDCLHT